MEQEINRYFENLWKQDRKWLKNIQEILKKNIQLGLIPEKLSMPLGIQLELTYRCNMYCQHCYNRSGENLKDLMSPDDWLDLAHLIVKNGGVFQIIISGGEPLLLGESLYRIMDIFADDGAHFILLTNGYLLNDKWIEKFQKYPFAWLQISIDSADPDRHDKFRNKKGAWEKAVSAALDVSQAGIPLKIASTIIPTEIPFIEDLINLAISLGASAIIIGDVMPSGRAYINKNLILSPEEKKKFLTTIRKLQIKYEDKIIIETSYSIRTQLEYLSIGPLEGVIIRPNGDVRVDCVAPFVIGNVKTTPFDQIWKNVPTYIWNHEKIQKFIQSVDYITGFSEMIENYIDKDMEIFK